MYQFAGTPGLVYANHLYGNKLNMFRENELPIVLQKTTKAFANARLTGGGLGGADMQSLHDVAKT